MKIFSLCLSILTLSQISLHIYAEPLKVDVGATSAILMNADTGAILFEKDAYTLQYPASTTKVATALYALHVKRGELDTIVIPERESLGSTTHDAKRKVNYSSPAYWLETDGTHIGIKNEEEFTIHDLLKGMLIPSGNDAANVLAQGVSGNIPKFMDDMNVFLKGMGCLNTKFLNPHGLHHPEHQTTAYDLALIAQEALKDPVFCDIISQTRFMRPKTNKQKATTLLQTNRLMRQGKHFYAKAIGGKTGYHAKARQNLVVAARSNGRTLIAVLLKNEERNKMFQDAIKLFEAAFNQPKIHHTLLKAGPQKFTKQFSNTSNGLQTYLKEELSLDYYPAENPKPKCLLYWESLTLPIQKDQKVGELHLVGPKGEVFKKSSLFAMQEVNLKWPFNWLSSLKQLFNNHPILMGFSIVALLAALLFLRKLFRN